VAFAENAAVFLRDFGLACQVGSVGFTGILDEPDESLSMAGVNVLSTMYALTCQTSDVALAGIASGTTVTVAGQAYVVRDVIKQDDGAFTQLTLSK
jgi:hypothetical protein